MTSYGYRVSLQEQLHDLVPAYQTMQPYATQRLECSIQVHPGTKENMETNDRARPAPCVCLGGILQCRGQKVALHGGPSCPTSCRNFSPDQGRVPAWPQGLSEVFEASRSRELCGMSAKKSAKAEIARSSSLAPPGTLGPRGKCLGCSCSAGLFCVMPYSP